MNLRSSQTDTSPLVLPSDIGSIAFAMDEFFDVLDVLYLQGESRSAHWSRNDPSNDTGQLTDSTLEGS
jgi:hypothetical protein